MSDDDDSLNPPDFAVAEPGETAAPPDPGLDSLGFVEESGRVTGKLKVDLDAMRTFHAAVGAAIDRFNAPELVTRLTSASGSASGSFVEPGQHFNAAEEFRRRFDGTVDDSVPAAYAKAVQGVSAAGISVRDWALAITNNYQSGAEATQLEVGQLKDLFEGASGAVATSAGGIKEIADQDSVTGASADGASAAG